MKVLFFPLLAFILTVSFTQHLFAQNIDIEDTWSGIANVQGMELGIVFHIKKEKDGLSATMDSPDQDIFGIEVDKVSFVEKVLSLSIKKISLSFEGTYDEERDLIMGLVSQRGMKIEVGLTRGPYEAREYLRPQTPKEPFPYTSLEVTFTNKKADITLAGTLTKPGEVSKPPVAILISGSGAQDRNSEIMKHKPFWVIADFLSTQGIAVLRYDERGMGESTGNFRGATSEDFADDVEAAVAFLKKRKDVDRERIILIGHSEGGMVAPMVAARSKDVAGIVLLAAPGVGGDQILLKQGEDIRISQGMSETEARQVSQVMEGCFQLVKEIEEVNDLGEKLNAYLHENFDRLPEVERDAVGADIDAYIQTLIMSYSNKWMRSFIQHDPAEVLKQVTCPVLAVNGDKDLQVNAEINLQAIQQALEEGENTQVKTVVFPGHNHLFQRCETGAISEYIQIEETFSQEVMAEMMEWILSLEK